MLDNDITIVTAFFDIGRDRLPKEKYGRTLPDHQHRSIDKYYIPSINSVIDSYH